MGILATVRHDIFPTASFSKSNLGRKKECKPIQIENDRSKFSLTKNKITHGLWNYLQNLMQNINNYAISNFAYIISNI